MGKAGAQFTETKDHSKELEQDRAHDIDRMYQDLMKSQLTVVSIQLIFIENVRLLIKLL
jgi:hypothetical protein